MRQVAGGSVRDAAPIRLTMNYMAFHITEKTNKQRTEEFMKGKEQHDVTRGESSTPRVSGNSKKWYRYYSTVHDFDLYSGDTDHMSIHSPRRRSTPERT